MKALPIAATSVEALRMALASHKERHPSCSLAIVFASVDFEGAEIGRAFRERGIQVFGASSAGGILAFEDGSDSVLEYSIVGMLLDLNLDGFQLKLFDKADGAAVGKWAAGMFEDPALLLIASGLRTDGELLVSGIKNAAGKEFPIYGGMAGDDLRFSGSFVFDDQGVSGEGVIALAFDRRLIEVQGVAASGWEAVGGEKIITGSEGNIVRTIDGSPALDVYKEYLGIASDTDIIIPEYPLQILKDGYAVMRAALLSDPQSRALIYAGSVKEGSRVRFSTAPGIEITDLALRRMRQLHSSTPRAEALILFSCKGRHMALGPLAEDEVCAIQRIWGVPMAGFFAYGEIGNGPGEPCDFHNETCVLVTLQEGDGLCLPKA